MDKSSVAEEAVALEASAVRTPWREKCLRLPLRLKAVAHVKKKCNMASDCLAHGGLRDGYWAVCGPR